MSSFGLLLICIQVCLVQHAFGGCVVSPGNRGCGGGSGTSYGPGSDQGYGGFGIGNVAVAGELPVRGTTTVIGQLPIIGSVKFQGPVCASGSVTIAGRCIYGCDCQG